MKKYLIYFYPFNSFSKQALICIESLGLLFITSCSHDDAANSLPQPDTSYVSGSESDDISDSSSNSNADTDSATTDTAVKDSDSSVKDSDSSVEDSSQADTGVGNVECQDNDSDGWCVPMDCDDNNAYVHPGGKEFKDNQIDDDCDSQTDEDDAPPPVKIDSFIWIANTGEGTVSKIDTRSEIEVARYITSPFGMEAAGDPSRTSVNMAGDMIVLNRRHPTLYSGTASSVTKIAGRPDHCVDKNKNGTIETSSGPQDVLDWGKDECVLWNKPLLNKSGNIIVAARAAAWDGLSDPDTGKGGHVWVGSCESLEHGQNIQDYIMQLDGDSGEIIKTLPIDGCAYGAAMDSSRHVWFVDRAAKYKVFSLDITDFTLKPFKIDAGYGMAVDTKGRIWAAGDYGLNKISRYDPETDELKTITLDSKYNFPRGTATGIKKSKGYVWVAENHGYLLKLDEETMALAGEFSLPGQGTIGVAIDYDGYVWVVSQSKSEVYKFDPETENLSTIKVGLHPYTYSDMTGVQLSTQVVVD
jgi:sugar lactone lactonase YvrE